MPSLFGQLRRLFSRPPLQVGIVTSITAGIATIELAGTGSLHARGAANVGDQVYVRDGVIEGIAETLPVDLIDV